MINNANKMKQSSCGQFAQPYFVDDDHEREKSVGMWLVVNVNLSGCAATSVNYRPIVDVKGVDVNKFEGDLNDYRLYARKLQCLAKGLQR
ncbi:MAG: hypothetical protein K2P84_04360 [Undibacterium sp.]|nr:hypothetical protein [Undibacterium sp.]